MCTCSIVFWCIFEFETCNPAVAKSKAAVCVSNRELSADYSSKLHRETVTTILNKRLPDFIESIYELQYTTSCENWYYYSYPYSPTRDTIHCHILLMWGLICDTIRDILPKYCLLSPSPSSNYMFDIYLTQFLNSRLSIVNIVVNLRSWSN